jgi:hypothetical protein
MPCAEGSTFDGGACAEGRTFVGACAEGSTFVGSDCAEGATQPHEGCTAADNIFDGA